MTNNRTTTKVDDIWLKASSVACSSVPVPATEPLPSDYFQTLLTHAQPSHSHYALGVCLHSGSDWYLGLPCIAKISQASVIDSCNPWISIRPDLKCCCALLQCFCPSIDACHTHANCMWTYSIVVSEACMKCKAVHLLCAVLNVNGDHCVGKQWKCAPLDSKLVFLCTDLSLPVMFLLSSWKASSMAATQPTAADSDISSEWKLNSSLLLFPSPSLLFSLQDKRTFVWSIKSTNKI